MAINPSTVQSGQVTSEGDTLYYEVRGNGIPLLMIAGGGGDSRWFTRIADILADDYKVILYDRRGGLRSSNNFPHHFDMQQHSRDGVAVLNAVGESSAYVVGNSSGAIIALDMAATQPQAVRAVIAHEPPLTIFHPHPEKWQRFFAKVYGTAKRFGTTLAMVRFVAGVRLPIMAIMKAAQEPELRQSDSRESRPDSNDYFVMQELLAVTHYQPDIARIQQHGIPIFAATGKESLEKKRFYAETAPPLAKLVNHPLILFPGHHMSFWDMAEGWAAVVREVLHRAQSQRDRTGTEE